MSHLEGVSGFIPEALARTDDVWGREASWTAPAFWRFVERHVLPCDHQLGPLRGREVKFEKLLALREKAVEGYRIPRRWRVKR